jgi:pyrroline-5-carboxylate reductase
MKTCFVGGGNMASAMISGMVGQGGVAGDIVVIEPLSPARTALEQRFGVRTLPAVDASIAMVDTIVLAVKPQAARAAIMPVAQAIAGQPLVISIMAGVRISSLRTLFADKPGLAYVRAMPNTPATIQRGISGIYLEASVSAPQRAVVETLLSTLGAVVWVASEAMIDAVTAVSGSGPAYVFLAIEALERAAVDLGFSATDARALALHTFRGAAELAFVSETAPAQLRENVTSKGGTTAAALAHMHATQFTDHWVAAVQAAAKRAHVLGDELAAALQQAP